MLTPLNLFVELFEYCSLDANINMFVTASLQSLLARKWTRLYDWSSNSLTTMSQFSHYNAGPSSLNIFLTINLTLTGSSAPSQKNDNEWVLHTPQIYRTRSSPSATIRVISKSPPFNEHLTPLLRVQSFYCKHGSLDFKLFKFYNLLAAKTNNNREFWCLTTITGYSHFDFFGICLSQNISKSILSTCLEVYTKEISHWLC